MNTTSAKRYATHIINYANQYGPMSIMPLHRDEIVKYESNQMQLMVTDTDPEDRCSICLCEWEPEEKGVRPEICAHVFHQQCVQMWIQEHHECPICRKSTKTSYGYQPYHPYGYCSITPLPRSLPLYPLETTLVVTIFIPMTQRHDGFSAQIHLPNNVEGQDLARLLQKAFQQRLLLRQEGIKLIPNGIELKRYPDAHFMARMRGDLDDAGL